KTDQYPWIANMLTGKCSKHCADLLCIGFHSILIAGDGVACDKDQIEIAELIDRILSPGAANGKAENGIVLLEYPGGAVKELSVDRSHDDTYGRRSIELSSLRMNSTMRVTQ